MKDDASEKHIANRQHPARRDSSAVPIVPDRPPPRQPRLVDEEQTVEAHVQASIEQPTACNDARSSIGHEAVGEIDVRIGAGASDVTESTQGERRAPPTSAD